MNRVRDANRERAESATPIEHARGTRIRPEHEGLAHTTREQDTVAVELIVEREAAPVERETTIFEGQGTLDTTMVTTVMGMMTLVERDDSQARDDECAKHDFGDLEGRRIMCDDRLRTYLRMNW